MPKQPIKQALSRSIGAEGDSVRDRFSRADTFFTPEEKQTKENEAPSEASQLVRDSFTFPPDDYAIIQEIIVRCLRQGISAKKSEVLRAALHTLAALPDSKLTKALTSVPKIKTGRPKKS